MCCRSPEPAAPSLTNAYRHPPRRPRRLAFGSATFLPTADQTERTAKTSQTVDRESKNRLTPNQTVVMSLGEAAPEFPLSESGEGLGVRLGMGRGEVLRSPSPWQGEGARGRGYTSRNSPSTVPSSCASGPAAARHQRRHRRPPAPARPAGTPPGRSSASTRSARPPPTAGRCVSPPCSALRTAATLPSTSVLRSSGTLSAFSRSVFSAG